VEALGEDGTPLLSVEPAYLNVLRLRTLVSWLPLIVAALVLDRTVLDDLPVQGLLPGLVAVLAIVVILVAPRRVWRRLGYRLDPALLQVVRGWMFHSDTVVPFVRVQHIDVTRGPLDKMFGTSTLVVHTAGTHNSVVTLPGLAPDRAADIRDVIRGHIRTDLE
jgi:membrane protein YdbS with pleckstrin-like domain